MYGSFLTYSIFSTNSKKKTGGIDTFLEIPTDRINSTLFYIIFFFINIKYTGGIDRFIK